MPNGWLFVLLVMGEKEVVSICVGHVDLVLNKIKPLRGWMNLQRANSLLTWLLTSISVLITNP